MLARATRFRMQQRQQRADRAVMPTDVERVVLRRPDRRRPWNGVVAARRHRPAERQPDRVRPSPACPWPVLTKRRQARHDQIVVAARRAQTAVFEAVLRHRAGRR